MQNNPQVQAFQMVFQPPPTIEKKVRGNRFERVLRQKNQLFQNAPWRSTLLNKKGWA